MKKLLLFDYNNTGYMSIFSQHLLNQYGGITTKSMASSQKKQELVRDVCETICRKAFNGLADENDNTVSLLFAKDSRRLWRKEIFKEYKEHRAGQRDASPVDFNVVFYVFDEVWKILQDIFPYRFVQCENVEVDDIICEAIKQEYEKWDKFVIYSRDEDFCQLLTLEKVEVYNPHLKKYMPREDAAYNLFEKIILGDRSDNVPNILTESRKDRQPPILKKKIRGWFENKESFRDYIKAQTPAVQQHFIRNRKLIDMACIPEFVKEKIRVELAKPPAEFDLEKYMTLARRLYLDVLGEKVELITNNL